MKTMVKPRRAAAYCRVSTGMACQEGSYETQIQYYRDLIRRNPHETLIKVYADEASGRSTQGRPAFQQMMLDCEHNEIDVIYTKSISRFSRNILDCVTAVRRLNELGVAVIFEKECINTTARRNELFFHIMAIIAEEESKSIGRNLHAAIQNRHERGIPTGRLPYGYRRVSKNGAWRIDKSEACRVRHAFYQAAKGISYNQIRAELDAMERAENTAVSWSQSRKRLPMLLRHIAYTGDYITDIYYNVYSKNGRRYSKRNTGERVQVYLEGHHEAIVSKAQFERVQTLIRLGLLHSGRKHYTQEQLQILNDPNWL